MSTMISQCNFHHVFTWLLIQCCVVLQVSSSSSLCCLFACVDLISINHFLGERIKVPIVYIWRIPRQGSSLLLEEKIKKFHP
ncbi:hypothetical protein KP509_15G059800 [Ceratopteris richardii]|uniref:Secreted protein n=1 Tax=Ceratopteris richardii TaxID=49495 RepID=A0A8T2T8D6_CERRI|nr:hypothetical protein KP509_15G059800 [Ceratopteris richardii]